MTNILLIRHAQSANNALPEHQRVCDPQLTELGQRQAALTADALASVPLTHLYCSPFLRALETMRPIAEAKRMTVAIRGDIFEQGGCYSGHLPGEKHGEAGFTSSELADRYPTWTIDERIGPLGWWGRPYECLKQATQRARCVADWMVDELTPLGGNHALLIHADFKRLLIGALLGQRAAELMPVLGPMHNVGITRFQWELDHWQLVSLNATTHMPADCVT